MCQAASYIDLYFNPSNWKTSSCIDAIKPSLRNTNKIFFILEKHLFFLCYYVGYFLWHFTDSPVLKLDLSQLYTWNSCQYPSILPRICKLVSVQWACSFEKGPNQYNEIQYVWFLTVRLPPYALDPPTFFYFMDRFKYHLDMNLWKQNILCTTLVLHHLYIIDAFSIPFAINVFGPSWAIVQMLIGIDNLLSKSKQRQCKSSYNSYRKYRTYHKLRLQKQETVRFISFND